MVGAGAVGELQQQRHGVLRDGDAAVIRHICDGDAAPAHGLHIDVVVAGGEDADVAHARTGGEHLFCDLRFVDEDHLCIANATADVLLHARRIHAERAKGRQHLPVEIARVQRVAVKNHHLHAHHPFSGKIISHHDTPLSPLPQAKMPALALEDGHSSLSFRQHAFLAQILFSTSYPCPQPNA